MISKRDMKGRTNMMKNMNKTFALFLTLVLVMMGGVAFGQRESGNSNNNNATTQHVTVGGSVFGGGNLAPVAGNTSVLLDQQGATIGTRTNSGDLVEKTGDVYGGGALANVGTDNTNTTTVNILDGIVEGSVYGGGLGDSTAVGYGGTANIAALVYGKVYVNIGAYGATQTDATGNATINGCVFGCNNINGTPLDDVFVHVYKTNHTVNNYYPDTIGEGSTIEYMDKLRAAHISANADENYAIKAVYGGGNKASYKPAGENTTTVHVHYCSENTIKTVYGGGNAANVGDTTEFGVNIPAHTHLIIDGGRFDQVFGGGNGYSASGNHTDAYQNEQGDCTSTPTATACDDYNPGANIFGSATTDINGGLYNQVFGGSNQYGNIASASLNINGTPGCVEMILESFCGGNEANMTGGDINATIANCDIRIGTLYGGSNNADILKDDSNNGGNVTLNVLGGNYDYVFGGSKGISTDPADIAGNVTLNLHGGTISSAYGGSDVKGNIYGDIAVNVLDTVTTCPLQVDTVYGAGRDAYYTPTNANAVSPIVKIQHAKIGHGSGATAVPGCVFGGGKGSTATVTAHPTVIIGELGVINNPHNQPIETQATVTGDVYGGGNAAAVVGGTTVLVQKCNSRAKYVYGGGNAADVNSTKVYITGGTIDTLFGGGHGSISSSVAANVTGNDTISITGGTIGKAFAGSNLNGTIDGRMALNIDKSTASDACDLIVGEVYGGGNMAAGKAGTITIGCTGTLTDDHIANPNNIGTTLEGIGTVYGGANKADIGDYQNHSNIVLNIKNGIINNVFGGNNTSGTIHGTIQVNIDSVGDCSTNWYVGNVYGGGNLAKYGRANNNYPEVNIIKGTISHDVFGGGLGDGNNESGRVTGNPVVNINGGTVNGNTFGGGSLAPVVGYPIVNAYKGSTSNIFGGGRGSTAKVTGNTTVNINQTSGQTLNVADVFGGGDVAMVDGSTTIQFSDGTARNLFGGGNRAAVKSTATITISGGNVTTGVYGGCNENRYVDGKVTVNIAGGTIGADGATANIHGGGYGKDTTTGGDVEVNIYQQSGENPPDAPVIWGDVYGGSALGSVNSSATTPAVNNDAHTYVTLTKGTVHGDIYGGGLGQTSPTPIEAKVWSPVQVTVYGGKVTGSVYGCNNVNGAPQSTVNVDIYGTDTPDSGYALGHVFGGGNAAAYGGTPVVKVHNCNNSIEYVYGGGNKASVANTDVKVYGGNTIGYVFGGGNGEGVAANYPMVSGNASDSIYGGTILKVFAGNNSSGLINGSSSVYVNKEPEDANGTACDMKIGEVYGGGNFAAGKAGTITIGCTGDWTTTGEHNHTNHNGTNNRIGYELEGIGTVYGGANQAAISNDITLNIVSGIIDTIFGGNNQDGNISGKITVNIEKNNSATCADHWYVGNVYGGGNLAKYNAPTAYYPQVNIKNGIVSGSVFGGGKGDSNDDSQEPGMVTGIPVVTIGDSGSGCAQVIGNVYGGGDAAKVVGNTKVVYDETCALSSVANLFGGGNSANVENVPGQSNGGETKVTFRAGNVLSGIYGGCNEKGNVTSTITVNVEGGIVGTETNFSGGTLANVHGGGYGFNTSTDGDVKVNVSGGAIYGDVYGGSALGNVNSDGNDNTTVKLTNGTIHGDLYGGGLGNSDHPAAINGAVHVTVNGGTVTNVFGCNNLNGAPQSTVTVDINETSANTMTVTNVYGGGNKAAYGGSPDVNIKAGTVSGKVFGGGNDITTANAGILNSNVEMTGGTVLGGVYGGCNVNGTVTGNSEVTIMGGTIGSNDLLNAATPVTTDVFGGGLGENTKVDGNVTVTITKASGNTAPAAPTIYGNVYGGSALGQVNNATSNSTPYTTTVEILDGTLVSKSSTDPNNSDIVFYTGGNVFGGGLGESGNANKGKVNGKVVVNIGAGTPNETTPYTVNVTGLSGNATIGGNVYGCNNAGGSPQSDVTVNIFQTAHTTTNMASYTESDATYAIANVFGGGNEANFSPAEGKTYVNVYTCANTIRRVFGGGNAASTPEVVTHIQGGRLFQVFGGGNGERGENFGADIHGDVTLNLHGGNIGEYYGGSNQNGVISGNITTNVLNDGPCESVIIDDFFCGGNFVDIYGDLITTIACSDGHIKNLYGGCNQATIYGNVVLNLCGGNYENVFGGSKGKAAINGVGGISADILHYTSEYIEEHPGLTDEGGNVTLNLYGGTIENVFGGSNINGNIEGNIIVNVLDSLNISCPLYITNIYGGSNLTDYVPDSVNHEAISDPNRISPVVNLVHAKYGIAGNVYGASKGNPNALTATKVMANPLVNIGYDDSMDVYIPSTYSNWSTVLSAPRAIVAGSVFGGGDAAEVQGNTAIFLRNRAKVFGNVYGGGNMGEVSGDTKVIVNGERQ